MATSKPSPVLDFLGRNSNLSGSVGAVVAMAGTFAATMNPLISVGLGVIGYGAGFLLLSGSKQEISIEDAAHDSKVEVDALSANITSLRESIEPHSKQIPSEIMVGVEEVLSTAEDILPRWDKLPRLSDEKHTINAIFTNYLPAIITNYLNLPKSYYKNAQKQQVGQEVVDQLSLINGALVKIREGLYSGVEQDIKVQGIFLKGKFQEMENALKL